MVEHNGKESGDYGDYCYERCNLHKCVNICKSRCSNSLDILNFQSIVVYLTITEQLPQFQHNKSATMLYNDTMSDNSIRIFITDDHEMARFALTTWIEADTNTPSVVVVGTASCGNDTLKIIAGIAVDILLIDIDLPDTSGLEVTKQLRAMGFTTNILCMSGSHLASSQDVINAGANGFVSKEESHAVFLEGIRWIAVNADSVWLSPYWHRQAMKSDNLLSQSHLTPAERNVLRHIRLSNKEIATELNLSESTVKNHLWSIYQKLGISSRREASDFALRTGIIPSR